MNDSERQSHLCFIRVCIPMVLQLSFSFLRNQPFNLMDGAVITDPNLAQTDNSHVFL